jgi:KRAB domain-containing zinc finger protein
MKISSSRCTTITNGKITSSIQRNKSLSTPISIVHIPSSSSLLSQIESTTKNQIIIRKTRHKENNTIKLSYTCDLCACRCWSIRTMHRHIRLHADVRPYSCNICQLKFKSYGNLMKHFKTSRHQQNKETNEKKWTVDTQALEEQSKF